MRANRIILKAIDCSSEGHHALRNAFTTLILTGTPAFPASAHCSSICSATCGAWASMQPISPTKRSPPASSANRVQRAA